MNRLRAVSQFVAIVIITVVLLELALRVIPQGTFGETHEVSHESAFWVHDEQLGWTGAPSSSGTFQGLGFSGDVHFDENGVRQNARLSTFRADYQSIFFIGDSVVAALEVDDDETPAAQLEQLMRAAGRRVNVINLGVRGYGTDQAVEKALAFSQKIDPVEIIYMFVSNDFFNNNTLKNGGRMFGKGAFVRDSFASGFRLVGVPVPRYPPELSSVVTLDAQCNPKIETERTAVRSPSALELSLKSVAFRHSRVYQEIWRAKTYLSQLRDARMLEAYNDSLARCLPYIEDQTRFVLRRLRSIASLQRLYLVGFDPSPEASRIFRRMTKDGLIDGYTDLLAGMEKWDKFRCKGDPHFCEEGTRWIAERVYREFYTKADHSDPR